MQVRFPDMFIPILGRSQNKYLEI